MNTKSFDTLVEALQDLRKRDYTLDFELQSNQLDCSDGSCHMPNEFTVVEHYRFEGMSSAGDNSILMAIETSDGRKGTLVDAYGTYADSLSPEMLERLRIKH